MGSILDPKRGANVFRKRSKKNFKHALKKEGKKTTKMGQQWLPKAIPKKVFFGSCAFIDFCRMSSTKY